MHAFLHQTAQTEDMAQQWQRPATVRYLVAAHGASACVDAVWPTVKTNMRACGVNFFFG